MARSGQFAETTGVPTSQTRGEIEEMLAEFGAKGVLMGADYETGETMLQFIARDRLVKFTLMMPQVDGFRLTAIKKEVRSEEAMWKAYHQACRQRMRQLKLVLKAKLESIETNIETFEQAFLANVVWPDGRTTHELIEAEIETAYDTGEMRDLKLFKLTATTPRARQLGAGRLEP